MTRPSVATQAEVSVYEEFLGPSAFSNHGERVVVDQRMRR